MAVFSVNLSIADTMVSLLNVTFNFYYMLTGHWPFGFLYCKISTFISVLSICGSVFTMVAISVDRWVLNALFHPLNSFFWPPFSRVKAFNVSSRKMFDEICYHSRWTLTFFEDDDDDDGMNFKKGLSRGMKKFLFLSLFLFKGVMPSKDLWGPVWWVDTRPFLWPYSYGWRVRSSPCPPYSITLLKFKEIWLCASRCIRIPTTKLCLRATPNSCKYPRFD